MDDPYFRQRGMVDMDALHALHVTLIGCGALGSFCGMALAKMGVQNLHLWDGDELEPHNLSNQMFPEEAVGSNKAEALAGILEDWGGAEPEAHGEHFEGGDVTEVTIFAVDDIETRTDIWENTIEMNPDVSLLVDGRMGAETGELRTCHTPFTPSDAEEYDKTLVDPENTTEQPCTAQSIMYCATTMAAMMAGCVKKYIADEDIPTRRNLDMVNYDII